MTKDGKKFSTLIEKDLDGLNDSDFDTYIKWLRAKNQDIADKVQDEQAKNQRILGEIQDMQAKIIVEYKDYIRVFRDLDLRK